MACALILYNDAKIAEWVYATFKLFPMPVNRAIGLTKDGNLVGAILLQNYNGSNIELSYYGPGTLSAGIVRVVSRIGILEFNLSRVTVVTSKKNKKLMRSLQRFGFSLEGAQKCFYGPDDTARNTGIRFVLFRDRIEKLAGLPHALHTATRL